MTNLEENEAVARRYLTEVISEGRMELLDELVSEDVINHDPASSETITPEEARGFEGFREHVKAIRTGMPDVEITIEDTIAAEDRVMVRFTITGTHEDTFAGIEATGNRAEQSGMVVYRIEDGTIVERWSEMDTLEFIEQLGVTPSSGEEAAH